MLHGVHMIFLVLVRLMTVAWGIESNSSSSPVHSPSPVVFNDSFSRPDGSLGNEWVEGWAATGNYSRLGLHSGAVAMVDPTIRNGTYPPPCNTIPGSSTVPPGDIIAGVGCAWRDAGATSVSVSIRWSGLWQFPHHIEATPLLHVTPGSREFGIGIWPAELYEKPVFLVGAIGNPGRFFKPLDAAVFNHTDGQPRTITVHSNGTSLRFFLDGAPVQLTKAGYEPLAVPEELRGSTMHGFSVDTHCVSPYHRATRLPAITQFELQGSQ